MLPPYPKEPFPDLRSARRSGSWRRPARAPHVVETLNREIAKIIVTPGFHQRMAAIGVDVVGTTSAAYAKIISDDCAKWGKVVTAAGIKPD